MGNLVNNKIKNKQGAINHSFFRETLCVIPARGGSKGIPLKNIADLAGKPLIAYSILAALATPSISRIIVSTDDERIAETALKYGAEVPFLRPKKLSTDNAGIGESIGHVLKELRALENYQPQAVCELYPTHPFRNPELIDFLIKKVFEGYSNVITVKKIDPSLIYYYSDDDGQSLHQMLPEQQPEYLFRHYGYFNCNLCNNMGYKGIYLHEITDKSALMDIDTPLDLQKCTKLINRGLVSLPFINDLDAANLSIPHYAQ